MLAFMSLIAIYNIVRTLSIYLERNIKKSALFQRKKQPLHLIVTIYLAIVHRIAWQKVERTLTIIEIISTEQSNELDKSERKLFINGNDFLIFNRGERRFAQLFVMKPHRTQGKFWNFYFTSSNNLYLFEYELTGCNLDKISGGQFGAATKKVLYLL